MRRLRENPAPTAFNPYAFAVGIIVLFVLFAFAYHFRVRPQSATDANNATTSNGNSFR